MSRKGRVVVASAATLGLAAALGCSATQVAWYGHTPDRKQLIEVRQKGDVQWLALGGRVSRPYRAIPTDSLAFDAESRRLAFAAEVHDRPERWTVVVDFVEGRTWDGVAGLRFSPHGARLAYAVLDGASWRMVIDGAPGPAFETVDTESIAFSPDGKRVAYAAEQQGCARVVIDERAGDCAIRVVGLALGEVAERDIVVMAAGKDGADASVFVGGKRVLDVPGARSLAVDPGVRHWAVAAESPSGWHLLIDGLDGELFDELGRTIWAPDGRTLAYRARRRSAWHVVAGGRMGEPYAEVEDPVFAANGSHFGYMARDPGRSVVTIDSHVVWESDAPATSLALSEDGSRRGWVYRDGPGTVIAVDDQRYAFEVVVERTLRFSRDGRHWAALVGSLAERRLFVTVDGRSILPFDAEELFGSVRAGTEAYLGSWVSAELELYLARAGGRS